MNLPMPTTHPPPDMNATDPDAWNPWFDGQLWAKPSATHLRQLMRQVITHPDEAAARGRAARQHLLNKFTPEVLARRVRDEVLRVQAKLLAGGTPTARRPRSDSALHIAPGDGDRGGQDDGAALSRTLWLVPGAIPTASGRGQPSEGTYCHRHPDLCERAAAAAAAAAATAAPTPMLGFEQQQPKATDLMAQAQAAGFSRIGAGGTAAGLDPVRTTLAEMLERLEAPRPIRTYARQQPPQAAINGHLSSVVSGAAAGVGEQGPPPAVLEEGSSLVPGRHPDGQEPQKQMAVGARWHRDQGAVQDQVEDVDGDEEDDGAIVLHTW
jgi:hypothetical protein